MRGDFSSRYVDRDRNFSGVLHQQGRVQLDSDWNAQALIASRRQDVEARDAIGPGVAAVSADDPAAFKVETAQVVGTDVRITLDPGARTQPAHASNAEHFVYIIRGAGQARVGSQLYPLEPESILWLEPGDTYAFEAGAGALEMLLCRAPAEA